LIERGHTVTAVARNANRAKNFAWPDTVRFIACDVHQPGLDAATTLGAADAAMHLAWPGLPNYKALYHFEETLHADYRFLKALVSAGYKHLLVTGTCFEYGMQSGQLDESMETKPSNPYGLAKDTLRKFLESLKKDAPFTLQWARLFYLHGRGQNPGSLLAQLERALEQGDAEFPMSGGEQLRDYLPVERVASDLVRLVEHPECDGVVNICSGKPISVKRMVEDFLKAKGKDIRLNLGHYPYPDHEPFGFWGARTRWKELQTS
jgi:dTDP-6-deoxy-L-talose 4-dehydrogenase (NAD+)